MKANAKQILEQIINDNKYFIKYFGLISEYLSTEIEESESLIYQLLTDEECLTYDTVRDMREELMYPIWQLVAEYNLTIDEYFNTVDLAIEQEIDELVSEMEWNDEMNNHPSDFFTDTLYRARLISQNRDIEIKGKIEAEVIHRLRDKKVIN